MPKIERFICNSEILQESEKGFRFGLPELGERVTGFAIRYQQKVYAYVNQCAHVPVELDWNEGDFFNTSKDFLICATHGAEYRPKDGYCVIGPCQGKRLKPIEVLERENQIFIHIESK